VVPREGYLAQAHQLLKAHKALLIADEVQTGLARTGRMLCQEWDGARVGARGAGAWGRGFGGPGIGGPGLVKAGCGDQLACAPRIRAVTHPGWGRPRGI
jgi:hypothetical protein